MHAARTSLRREVAALDLQRTDYADDHNDPIGFVGCKVISVSTTLMKNSVSDSAKMGPYRVPPPGGRTKKPATE